MWAMMWAIMKSCIPRKMWYEQRWLIKHLRRWGVFHPLLSSAEDFFYLQVKILMSFGEICYSQANNILLKYTVIWWKQVRFFWYFDTKRRKSDTQLDYNWKMDGYLSNSFEKSLSKCVWQVLSYSIFSCKENRLLASLW